MLINLILTIETGRYDPTIPETTKVKRVYVTDGTDIRISGKSVAAYRVSHLKAIDVKNINTVRKRM